MFATFYTALGGVKAVVWTDVLQAVALGGGMVVVLLMADRAEGVERERFEAEYRAWITPRLAGTPAALCLGLEPEPLPDDAPAYVLRPPGLERRSLQMFFLQSDPRECWDELFGAQDAWLRDAGLGQVSYAAPFIPTIPGTDRYADELW